jgi:hypothetical protein
VACGFGGYGKSIACSGTQASAKASQAECLADSMFTKCANVASGSFLACQKKLSAKPCDATAVLATDPSCADMRACLK